MSDMGLADSERMFKWAILGGICFFISVIGAYIFFEVYVLTPMMIDLFEAGKFQQDNTGEQVNGIYTKE